MLILYKMKKFILFTILSIFSFSAYADNVSRTIYNSYVNKDMNHWKIIIDSLQVELEKGNLKVQQKWELLNYQYGYIAWAISKKKEKNKQITIKRDKIYKYFPESYSNKEIEDVIEDIYLQMKDNQRNLYKVMYKKGWYKRDI